MSKALFVSLPGHVDPTLGLVTELIQRGEEVTYYITKEYQAKIEETGAQFVEYKSEINLLTIAHLFNSGQHLEVSAIMSSLKGFEALIDAVIQERGKYDYFIYDLFLPFGEKLGKKLGIPTVCSITTFALNVKMRDQMMGGSLRHLKDMITTSGCFSRFKEILMMGIDSNRFKQIWNESKELYNYIKRIEYKYNFGINNIDNVAIQKAMLNIVYTSHYFQPYADKFDQSYKFVGPSIVPRNDMIDFDLQGIKRSIVYISLGTVFSSTVGFYEDCMEAFKEMNIQFIMAVGKNIDINRFKKIPANFIVKNFLPQVEILKNAAAFVTHGGMNSVNEGLFYGVPLIVVPQSVDHPLVAQRVVELGAGISLDKDEITHGILQRTLAKILTKDSYRRNSQIIGESLRIAGGHKKAADEILQWKEHVLV